MIKDKILSSIEVACGPQCRSNAMKSEKIGFKWNSAFSENEKTDGKRFIFPKDTVGKKYERER